MTKKVTLDVIIRNATVIDGTGSERYTADIGIFDRKIIYIERHDKNPKKVFDYVKTRNCVLFFDEFDTIGKERGDSKETGEIKRVVSSLLLQIDTVATYVVIITASNHPELLDRAVWRRFQLRLELKRPNKKQVVLYIDRISQKSKCNFNYSSQTLSEKLKGNSYSEIEEFCTDIIRKAVLQHKQDDARTIVSQSLKQWQIRFSGNNIGV